MAGKWDTEVVVSQWGSGKEDDHANKGSLQTVSEVQECGTQGSPYPW